MRKTDKEKRTEREGKREENKEWFSQVGEELDLNMKAVLSDCHKMGCLVISQN